MSLKIEFTATTAAELKEKIAAYYELFGEATAPGFAVEDATPEAAPAPKTKAKAEPVEAADEPEEEKPAAKTKTTSKKAKGPSEATLRKYATDLGDFFLNDPEEAPKLAKLLDKFDAEDIDSVAAEDLPKFADALYEAATGIWDASDVEKVPTK